MSCRRNDTGMNTFVFTDSEYIQTSAKPADSRIYLTLHDQLSQFISFTCFLSFLKITYLYEKDLYVTIQFIFLYIFLIYQIIIVC